jgi:phage N-6-adenine-methyltransferase
MEPIEQALQGGTVKTVFNTKFDSSDPRIQWATPQPFFDALNEEFGPFDLDPCALEWNAKCERYFTPADNGLMLPWGGRVYMNPPYAWNVIQLWARKAALEIGRKEVELIVGLLPARTETSYFHDFIWQKPGVEVRFVRGRVKFLKPDGERGSPRHGSMIVIWRKVDD